MEYGFWVTFFPSNLYLLYTLKFSSLFFGKNNKIISLNHKENQSIFFCYYFYLYMQIFKYIFNLIKYVYTLMYCTLIFPCILQLYLCWYHKNFQVNIPFVFHNLIIYLFGSIYIAYETMLLLIHINKYVTNIFT